MRKNIMLSAILTILLDLFMLFVLYTTPSKLFNSFWGKYFVLSLIIFTATFKLYYSARVYSLFAISQIVFFPLYVKYSTLNDKAISFMVVFVFVSVQFWRMLLANANEIIPYEFNYQDINNTFFAFLL